MTENVQARESAVPVQPGRSRRRRLRNALIAVAVLLLVVLIVPPLVSVSRYKNRITQLIATSLGRPVRLSSVKLRLLPWPGFVLTDLSVAEDPAYGAEPVLHAESVTASIGLVSLWRGRLEIGSISVDNASLNLVRAGPGRWNLDPLFRTAAAKAGSAGDGRHARRLPYLEASDSRINIKNGVEKLPFSLINTDLEFWQENSGEWHIRLRGQPARTDVSLYQEDTGVVRLEATIRRATSLREMPLHLDLDWREAQLGQLARLVTGSDPGWRGDLTGELHLDGTADAAKITSRLRATGVHRAEFAPAEPMDFDANCSLLYHYAQRALENLDCNSPLGAGRISVTGNLPGASGSPQLSVALDHIPIAAGLDALRTVHSDVPSDLDVKGTVSGKISYAPPATAPAIPIRGRSPKALETAESPLAGTLAVEGFELSGADLSRSIQIPKIVLEPAAPSSAKSTLPLALTGTADFPAGGSVPLALNLRLARSGYQVTMRGPVSVARAKELLGAAGLANVAGWGSLAGDPVAVDLTADGPWLQSQEIPLAPLLNTESNGPQPASPLNENADNLQGTITVRDARWNAGFLANPVQISQATLHLGNGEIRWDPITFSYGSVKGSASLAMAATCAGPAPCPPQFQLRLGSVDASTLQTAILGVQQKGTLFSALLDRLRPSSAPPWPQLDGTVDADSLVLGPVTLEQPEATVHILSTGAEITNLAAGILGGRLQGSGAVDKPQTDQDKPAYTFDCQFENLDPQAVGRLIGQHWSGATLNGDGKIQLSGYAAKDLANTAKGTLHFAWRRGAITTTAATGSLRTVSFPPALAHFDAWTAEAAIGDNTITLGANQIRQGSRKRSLEGTLTFGDPPSVRLSPAQKASPDRQ